MPQVKFTQEDLLERTQLNPGWQILVCKSIEEGPGKNDPSSVVYSCVFVVDCGTCPANGVPIRHWFSEKAMGRIVDYIKCFIQKVEPGMIYDLDKTIGLKVEGYCQYDPGQGYNVIKDWRPLKKG